MKLLISAMLLLLSFSIYSKTIYIKCEVENIDGGKVELQCDTRKLDDIEAGDKVKIKATVDDDIEGC